MRRGSVGWRQQGVEVGVERGGELDEDAEARLAATALEEGDLGAVQLAAGSQLGLGEAGALAGLAEV